MERLEIVWSCSSCWSDWSRVGVGLELRAVRVRVGAR